MSSNAKDLMSKFKPDLTTPEDHWKIDTLASMLKEQQERREAGEEGEEVEKLDYFIHILCAL